MGVLQKEEMEEKGPTKLGTYSFHRSESSRITFTIIIIERSCHAQTRRDECVEFSSDAGVITVFSPQSYVD